MHPIALFRTSQKYSRDKWVKRETGTGMYEEENEEEESKTKKKKNVKKRKFSLDGIGVANKQEKVRA